MQRSLAFAMWVPLVVSACAGARDGPSSHGLVLGQRAGPLHVSLIESTEREWRPPHVRELARSAFQNPEGWWPSEDGTRVVITGTRSGAVDGSLERRMALLNLDDHSPGAHVFGPPVNPQGTSVGWAPDGSGFALIASAESGGFACHVFDRNAALLAVLPAPHVDEGTDAHLSADARWACFEGQGGLQLFEVQTGKRLEVPEHLRRRDVVRAIGWIDDGSLALFCVGRDAEGVQPSARDVVFVQVEGWEERREPVPRHLGAVLSVHPSGWPWLCKRRVDAYWYRWKLLWASGAEGTLRGPWSTDNFRGWGWVREAAGAGSGAGTGSRTGTGLGTRAEPEAATDRDPDATSRERP